MNAVPYRQIHMDFHTSPLIPGVGSGFDAGVFVEVLKEARVNSINLFGKCHHGMYYYPSRLGKQHPNLAFDLLGAQIQACRAAGIRTSIYTTAAWNEDWADRHPEWMQVDAEGVAGKKKPFAGGYSGWRYLCLNNPDHLSYLRAEMGEMETYRSDGYWIDIILQRGCVCGHCRKDMRELGMDPTDPDQVRRHDRIVEIRFMKTFWDHAKASRPGVDLYFNGIPYELDLCDRPELSSAEKRKFFSFIDIESLPSEYWGYTHFPIAASYLGWRDQVLTMMNGKFHKSWGDFGSLRNLAALEYECFRAVSQGARCCIGDQLHPTGLIDRTVYQRIGQVYRAIEAREPWLHDTKRMSEIGVYVTGRVLEDPIDSISASVEGAYRILTETHRCFDFIDYTSDLTRYELVILPDMVKLNSEEARKLETYRVAGGRILVTGSSGLDEGGERQLLGETGASYAGPAEYTPRYARLEGARFPAIPAMDYVMYEPGVTLRAQSGAEILARVVNPYFNRSWDRFSSHRQTAPHELTNDPFIVRRGGVITIAGALFRDYTLNGNKVFKDIVDACLDMLLPLPRVRTDLPSTAELTIRGRGKDMVVHVLHYVIERKCRTMDIVEEAIPLTDRSVSVRCERKPDAVRLVPELVDAVWSWDGPYVRVSLERVDGHRMVLIQGACA